MQRADSKLTLALGKDTSGSSFSTDLARDASLVGRRRQRELAESLSINAIILSLPLKSTPQDVQFIMVDPKMLELTIYEDIPHLLPSVVTDPKKAAQQRFWGR